MRRTTPALLALAGLGAAGGVQAADAAEGAWQWRLRSDRHSDPLTLRELADERHERAQPRSGRSLAYLEDEARLSHRRGAWTWSLLARGSATLVLNRDAVELVGQIERGEQPATDRRWQVDARFRGFTGAGLELGHRLALGGPWQAAWSVQALSLARLHQRDIHGPVSYQAASDSYGFDLRSSEANDHLRFPFRRDFGSRGAGLLFGGEIGWRDGGAEVVLGARDAGWLRWSGLPRQEAQLSSDVQERDAEGFIVYRPLVEGRNRQGAYTTRWPVRWSLRGQWTPAPGWALGASVQTRPGFGALPALSLQRLGPQVQLGLGWQVHERRASVALAWKGWRLEAGADRLGTAAHSRLLALSYGMAL